MTDFRLRQWLLAAFLFVAAGATGLWGFGKLDDTDAAGNAPPSATVALVAAALLLALALGWVPLRTRLLRRAAAGGSARCLHCGARRVQGIAFCPHCGWRTPQEKQASTPPVDPWELDR